MFIDADSCAAADDLIETLRGFGANPYTELEDVHLSQIKFDDDGSAQLVRTKKDSETTHSLRPARANLSAIRNWGTSLDLEQDPYIDSRMVLAMIAEQIGCDALATTSRQLLETAAKFYSRSNTMSPADAIATIGLHLRLREDFVYKQSTVVRVETNSADYYSMMSHGLLPALWRWFALCPKNESPLAPSPQGHPFQGDFSRFS
ncbi:hypothetical protein ACMHYB_47990 [Sorangium sp. So ce1128]